MTNPLPHFDVDGIPEQAQVTRRLAERLNDAVEVNDALVAIVQAIMEIEAPLAAIMEGLDRYFPHPE